MKTSIFLIIFILMLGAILLPTIQVIHTGNTYAVSTGTDPIEPQPDPIPPDRAPGGSNSGSKAP